MNLKADDERTEKYLHGETISVEPGETYFLYVDFADKKKLVMGEKARILNELLSHEGLSEYIGYDEGEKMENILNKESGAYGISGVSVDFRDIEAEAAKGNKRAELAISAYAYKVAQYIAQYIVSLGGLDTIVFTAGIGENQFNARRRICENLKCFGVEIDEAKNHEFRDEGRISSPNSKVEVWVVPTNEELMIARDTKDLITR